ncbi:MAG: class I SAM-dependent methyltransferase [Syntrophales bacterium]|jgi:predicted O-methyltransferase YrrM|nr:class I SAM-dependent methyltransferase [Syntrophales bacterium]MDY0043514.1 class I SAM-dependent methyltransferase [Syntrophales bacterium]
MGIHTLSSYNFKGFLADAEAQRLYDAAKEASSFGPCLEIGSYCGKSTAFLAAGCKEHNSILFSIDHHRGSEEQQPGEEYFDPDLLDTESGMIDTFRIFRKTIADLDLTETVVPIVTSSITAARHWKTPLALVFIDGGHSYEAAFRDYSAWSPFILSGGYLLIHDIFPDPAFGGQAPYCVYRLAVHSGLFEELPSVETLGVLKRIRPGSLSQKAKEIWKERTEPS